MAGCAAVLCAVTGSGRLGLGDAPETAVGVAEGAVVHAPGYPVHVAAAAVFVRLVPIVSDDAALNLFSAAVTGVTAVLLFVVARRLRVSRPAAAVAALGWMTAASVWFYASYAKHDALTAAWWAMALAAMVTTDPGGPSTRRCAVVGVLIGSSLGVGWAPIVSGGLAVVWWARPRAGSVRRLVAVAAGAVAGAVAVGGLVLVLSAGSPEVSWGGVDGPGGLVRLWAMDDFGFTDRLTGGGAPATQTRTDNTFLVDLVNYLGIVGRDLGPALAVAGVAGVVIWWRSRREVAQVLILAVGGNLVVLALGLGASVWGFRGGIVQGGFLAPTLLGLALAAGPAFDAAVAWCAQWWSPRVAWAALAVLVVGTSVVAHRPAATQLRAPVTRTYAAQVLDPLPAGAVVLAGTASSSFPLRAAQAAGVRPDVTVVAVDGLSAGWYRDQLDTRSDQVAPVGDLTAADALDVVLDAEGVVLDHAAQSVLAERVAYQPTGLTAVVIAGPAGFVSPSDPDALVARVASEAEASGIIADPARRRWPNDEITRAYAAPLLLVAQDAINDRDWDLARRALSVAARLEPDRAILTDTLDQLPP